MWKIKLQIDKVVLKLHKYWLRKELKTFIEALSNEEENVEKREVIWRQDDMREIRKMLDILSEKIVGFYNAKFENKDYFDNGEKIKDLYDKVSFSPPKYAKDMKYGDRKPAFRRSKENV